MRSWVKYGVRSPQFICYLLFLLGSLKIVKIKVQGTDFLKSCLDLQDSKLHLFLPFLGLMGQTKKCTLKNVVDFELKGSG